MTKDELRTILKESLSVRVSRGDFVSPNDLIVRIEFDGELISEDSVWMQVRAEYEG